MVSVTISQFLETGYGMAGRPSAFAKATADEPATASAKEGQSAEASAKEGKNVYFCFGEKRN